MSERFELSTADGRDLTGVIAGPPDGELLLVHHGTPGSGREIYPPYVEAAAARGVRIAAYTRPGGPGSDRAPRRTVADCAADAAAVADELGVERFYTLGGSGGGPHALACAALLADRVIATATVAAVAPFDAAGLEWVAGMGEENQAEIAAALAGPRELEQFIEAEAERLKDVTGEQIASALGDLVSAADRAVLTGAYAEFAAANLRHSISTGIWGWFDDDVALTSPWGFELDSIEPPVCLWHGYDDRFVPAPHGEWLADRLSGARVHLLDSHGHLSIMLGMFDELLADLLDAGS